MEKKKRGTKFLIWLSLFVGSIFIPVSAYVTDVITDSLLSGSYYKEWKQEHTLPTFCHNTSNITFAEYPLCLSNKAKFIYSLTFIVLPWVFYLFEFYHSVLWQSLWLGWIIYSRKAWKRLKKGEIVTSLISYLKSVSAIILES